MRRSEPGTEDESARRSIDLQRVIQQLHSALRGTHDLDEIFRRVYEVLPGALAVDRVSLMLYDPDRRALVSDRFIGVDRSQEGLVSAPQPLGHSISGRCFQERRPIVVHDCSQTDLIPPAVVASLQLRSTAAVPIPSDGEPLGVLRVDDTYHTHRFGPDAVAVLRLVADDLAFAIENGRMVSDLRRSDRAKEQFLALLAHELRNPLAAMMHAVELLQSPGATAAARERAIAVLGRQTRHQSRLVEDLLDIARVSSGKLALRRTDLDFVACIREAASDHREVVEHQGLTLSVELPGESVVIYADSTRLKQVVLNLLGNAAKFTPPGGAVCVSIHVDREAGEATLRVRDTGTGIEVEQLPRIFDPFAQAQAGLALSTGGLGLGLALVRAVAELHGGRVSAHSEGAGTGLEISVSLPICLPGTTVGDNR
jgi:signal transduction histidine kinase